eukprot:TRINITY_DN3051_c0_g1_i1.p1 TRINITY_DN3051_c0_g1~~TRINITY_DN3051_c0_g1_i1.p1  ORF type:complete len:560 (+),score=106.75 TRINITY_DN3051_c0_g1_i1:60-1739(+)
MPSHPTKTTHLPLLKLNNVKPPSFPPEGNIRPTNVRKNNFNSINMPQTQRNTVKFPNRSMYGGSLTSRPTNNKNNNNNVAKDLLRQLRINDSNKSSPKPNHDSIKSRPSTQSSSNTTTCESNSDVPLSPHVVLRKYGNMLTAYEKIEILDYEHVYYFGTVGSKHHGPKGDQFDDDRGDYQIEIQDHIGYKYEVLASFGKGSFGKVMKCFDHSTGATVALKMVRNKKRFYHQSLVETRILEHIRDNDSGDKYNMVRLLANFRFRGHLCLVFEPLSINLYEFMKENHYQPMSTSLIRRFTIQLLNCLSFLKKHQIVHCDIKPENVLMKQSNKSGIKVIDFGSSCFEQERIYTYIQSRFYRAPEIILGLPYGCPIDMWSLGCMLAEFHTGYPLFPGENEHDQLLCMMEILDLPPQRLIDASPRRKLFFDSVGHAKIVPNSRGKKRMPNNKQLSAAVRSNNASFIDFIDRCLDWNSETRMSPLEALQHPFIVEGQSTFRHVAPKQTNNSNPNSPQKFGNFGISTDNKETTTISNLLTDSNFSSLLNGNSFNDGNSELLPRLNF